MATHRAPRRPWFRFRTTTPLNGPDADNLEQPTAVADAPITTAPETPVAAVVDLAARRQHSNIRPTGADIVMMTKPATAQTVQAVYPDGSVAQVPCELRVVATVNEVRDGMILNLSGGDRSTAIAVTRSP